MSETSDIVNNFNNRNVVTREDATHLQNVDDLAMNNQPSIGNGRVTAIAQDLLSYDPESMVWQDSPNLALMIPSILKWLTLIFVWLTVLNYLAPSSPILKADNLDSIKAEKSEIDKQSQNKKLSRKASTSASKASSSSHEVDVISNSEDKLSIPNLGSEGSWYFWIKWLGIAVISYQFYVHLTWALRLKCTKYKMSSQRLIIQSGILSKTSNTYEIHNLSSGQIDSPFFPRMFGCSNLYVGIWLISIRNAEAVRDLIRNAGQIESSRIEKARWR